MAVPGKSNRRAFLKGKSAADALAGLIDSSRSETGEAAFAGPPVGLPDVRAEGYLLHLSRRAMACQFEIFLNAGQYPHDSETACAALDLVDQLEDQLSIYRDGSEISRLNRTAAHEAVRVEPRLYALLDEALSLSRQTDGAFDITAGPLARLWGFVQRSGAMPERQAIEQTLEQVGSRHVELDPQALSVRFTRAAVELNLGSIGKGYALDRCWEVLAAAGIADVLLHGGQSSVLARGACVEPGHPDAWTIGLRNPYRPELRLGQFRLRDRALATSGSGTQFFVHEGRRYGHILDPRSGWPAAGVLSATVVAPRAAQADALSTAFYVLGPARAAAFCAERPEIGFVLLCPGAGHGSVEIHTAGLTDGQFVTL